MIDEREIESLLRDMGDDEVQLSPKLRTAILADASESARPRRQAWRAWLGWGAFGVPAAVCGLWLGIAQPALVLQVVPGMQVSADSEDTLFEDIYGSDWEGWL